QDADVLRARLAGDLGAEVDLLGRAARAQSDAPAEEGDDLIVVVPAAAEEPALAVAAEVEERGAVEEEVAPLGKEQGKARQVDLALIDLGLREVGVHSEHGPQQRGRTVEEIDPRTRVAFDRGAATARRRLRGEDAIRFDVETVPLRHIVDAGDDPGVAHAAKALVSPPSRPQALFILPSHGALEVDAPRVAVGVEIQRAEGDRDLENPPNLAAPRPRVPDAVPLPVFAVDPEEGISHQPRRVHLEEIAGATVEKCIDGPLEAVVGVEPFVPSSLVANPLVGLGIEASNAHVQRLAIEGD